MIFREMVFEKLGTYPYQLWDIVSSPLDPAEFVEDEIEQCMSKIGQSLREFPESKDLYQELLKQPFLKENTALDILNSTMKTVGKLMRDFQVVNYSPKPPGHFTFRTKAMETAAKRKLSVSNMQKSILKELSVSDMQKSIFKLEGVIALFTIIGIGSLVSFFVYRRRG